MHKDGNAAVAHQFEEAAQQHEAATLGMWVFLATEVLFFGAMIMSYTVYRHMYPEAFAAAGPHMEKTLGTVNTGILLTSSLAAALAVHYARTAAKGKLIACLLTTALLGLLFDALKLFEYHKHYVEG